MSDTVFEDSSDQRRRPPEALFDHVEAGCGYRDCGPACRSATLRQPRAQPKLVVPLDAGLLRQGSGARQRYGGGGLGSRLSCADYLPYGLPRRERLRSTFAIVADSAARCASRSESNAFGSKDMSG
jgi:hypothetical protein